MTIVKFETRLRLVGSWHVITLCISMLMWIKASWTFGRPLQVHWMSLSIEPIWNCLDRQFCYFVRTVIKCDRNSWTACDCRHLENRSNNNAIPNPSRGSWKGDKNKEERISTRRIANWQNVTNVLEKCWLIGEFSWIFWTDKA